MTTATPPRPSSPRNTDLAEQFEGPIRKVRKSPLYVVGLLLVAIAMVLLPLIYLGLIALTGYGVFYHATENASILSGSGTRGRLVAYFGPLVAGVAAIVFMIKPIFARPARRDRRMSLVEANEPRLFAFVEKVCATVGAPKPRRIDVDCDINASASFRRGMWSVILPSDLVLTIGVPLVGGLSAREFAGVLAHEFGHFAQGMGMRLSYLIIHVSGWFARVVYQRDSWDEKLIELSRNSITAITVVFMLARFCVWLSRRILWLLMKLGQAVSCAMMRQMEYDADRYEIRLAGSGAFESTARKLNLLNAAAGFVHSDLYEAFKERRLGDNFAVLLNSRMESMPDEVRDAVNKFVDEGKTKLFSTHPSDRARIQRARKAGEEGVFRADVPAAELFSDFEGLSKAVTLAYYQELLPVQISANNLVSSQEMLSRQRTARKASDAARRYFLNSLTVMRIQRFDEDPAVTKLPARECLEKLTKARTALEKSAPALQAAMRRFAVAEETISAARAFRALHDAKVRIKPKDLELAAGKPDDVPAELDRALAQSKAVGVELDEIESVMRLRFECAITLLVHPKIAERLASAARLKKHAHKLTVAINMLRSVSGTLVDMYRDQPGLRALAGVAEKLKEPDADVISQAERILNAQHDRMSIIHGRLAHHPFPFKHADGDTTLARFLVEHLPQRGDLSACHAAAEQTLENTATLYYRMMGELAALGEAVEAALGLKPIEVPGSSIGDGASS